MHAAYLPSAVFFSSGPATSLITGVVTSAGKCVLVILVGVWHLSLHSQRLISHWSHILSLKMSSLLPISRLPPLTLLPVTEFILPNNFQ